MIKRAFEDGRLRGRDKSRTSDRERVKGRVKKKIYYIMID